MSAWKVYRRSQARRGWGSDICSRWIGRQQREAARPTGRTLPSLAPSVLLEIEQELEASEAAYRVALEAYEAAPVCMAGYFEYAREVYLAIDAWRDRARAAFRAVAT